MIVSSTKAPAVTSPATRRFAHNAALRLGYIDYKYSTAMSGWQIGPSAQPGQNWETAMNLGNNPQLQYSYPATVKNYSASIEVRF